MDHKYTWKIGVELGANRQLAMSKPLVPDVCLADLYNGRRFLVQAVFDAKPIDTAGPHMPRRVIQTWPFGTLTPDQLSALRARHKYTPSEADAPLTDIVIVSK